jgi:hypothetical protein
MTTKTINAAANPAMANNLLNQVINEQIEDDFNPEIKSPVDNTVELPGGYITSAGELLRTAEVRELNGRDEEAISKASNVGKALVTIIQRGTVSIGHIKSEESVLDSLLAADLDALLLGIIKATFGVNIEIPSYCAKCEDYKIVTVDLNTDIKTKVLADPLNDRVFTVKGKKDVFVVSLPDGSTQKALIKNADKTEAEQTTVLLEHCVLQINGSPVYSPLQVQNLGMVDRKNIVKEINKRVPGPQFADISVTCPECEGEVTVSINLGTLFRL